jgi:cellulose synthase operon protein C
MTCEQAPQVHALTDGELSPAQAAVTKDHLATCQLCQAELADLLQLEVAVAQVARRRAAQITPIRRPRWRSTVTVAMALAAVVILYVVVRPRLSPPEPDDESQRLALVLPTNRSLELRLSWRDAAGYRPYQVARSAEVASSSIPLDALATLERRGDVHGVGVLALLNGDYRQAEAFLSRADTSSEVLADRGALALAQGDLERSLELFDQVLRASPGHPTAVWNRALALRDLGLIRSAAAAFRQIAENGETGWSAEARARAAALDADADDRRDLTDRVLAAGPQLAVAPDALAIADALRLPGLSRLFLYDALRSASSAQLPALRPLVEALDAGSGVIAALAKRSAALAAAHPALTATYAEILAGRPLTAAARGKYLAALRAARADDLLIVALVRLSPTGRTVAEADLPEVTRLAAASTDPWMQMFGIEQRAQAALAADNLPEAEALLLRSRLRCQSGGAQAPAFRCIKLGLLLGEVYGRWQRVPEARAELMQAWKLARAEREWLSERQLLEALSSLSVIADDATGGRLPLARATTDERVLREPDSCEPKVWARQLIALTLLNQLRVEEARAELAGTPPCDAPLTPAAAVQRIFVRAHLLREASTSSAIAALRAEIAVLRADPAMPPVQRALLDHAEGRLLIDLDTPAVQSAQSAAGPGVGELLLRKAIAAAQQLATADANARKVIAFSYSVLALAKAKRGDGAAAMTALADEQGVALPARCALGLAVEDQRRMAVARDSQGGWVVRYDEARTSTSDDPGALVTAEILAALAHCPAVDVLARPPLYGASRLLPEAMAWRYRSARREAIRPAGGGTLIVGDVEPPAALGLPHLASWRSQAGETLTGPSATPERVLTAIAEAGEVVIHAHGIGAHGADDASFLALSSDASGRYALTAAAVRATTLRRSPLVVLAACRASQGAPVLHEPWSLPAAFVYAGARAVVASTAPIPDHEAGEFFDGVRAAVNAGVPVAIAVRDVRVRWRAGGRSDWVDDVLVFE